MKKILLCAIIGIMIISLVSSLDFDNVKKYESSQKEITITNAFGLGSDLAKYTLTKNTDHCLIDCYAEGTATIYSKEKLFSNLNFKGKNGLIKNIKSYKIFIQEEENYFIEVNDYKDIILINGSIEKVNVGTHKEEKTRSVWKEYNGEVLGTGIYNWRIEGAKKKRDSVDWIASAFGTDFTEWAWWNAGYEFKREVTGLQGDIVLNVNGTSYTTLGGTDTMIYGTCIGVGCAIYYNDSSINAIASDVTEFYKVRTIPTISETGTPPANLTAFFQFDNAEAGKAINFAGANATYTTGVTQNVATGIGKSFTLASSNLNITGAQPFSGEKGTIILRMQPAFACGSSDRTLVGDSTDSYIILTGLAGTFQFRVGGGPWVTGACTSALWDAGDWIEITATWDTIADDYYLYLNKVLFASDLTTAKTAQYNNHLYIGSAQTLTQFANGNYTKLEIYNRILNSSEINASYDGTSLGSEESNIGLTLTLNSPDNNYNSYLQDVTFNCSGNDVTEIYNISLIVNGSVKTTNSSTGTNNISLISTQALGIGAYNWTCNATDNENNVGTKAARALNITGFVENSQTYNANTFIGNSEDFSVNVSYDSDVFSSIQASFYYNNTKYNGIKYGSGNTVMFNKTITIPSLSVKSNQSIYWTIELYDGSWSYINSTINNQTVDVIGIDDCSSYGTVIYNYTVYDEETKQNLSNTSVEIQINFYDKLKTVNFLNFSKLYSNTNPARVCLNISIPINVNYSIDSVVKYTANDTLTNKTYVNEHYSILSGDLSNTTVPNHISLFNLNKDDSTDFQLTFRDSSFSLAPNVLVYLYRQYVADNDFKIVEAPITDSNGQTVLHMVRNDVIYNLVFKDVSGNILGTFNKIIAFCQDYTIGNCIINLDAKGDTGTIYNYSSELGINYTIPTYSNTTKLVSFDFITDDLSPKTISTEIVRNNQFGNRSVCTNSITASTGTLNCNVSSVSSTDRFLFIYIKVDDKLLSQTAIDLESESFGFGIVNGAFYAFLLILSILAFFSEDKSAMVLSLIGGWAIILSLGLISGRIFGTATITTGFLWLVVSGVIFMWKIHKEEGG